MSAVIIHNHIKYTFIFYVVNALVLLLLITSSQELKHYSQLTENVLVLVIGNGTFYSQHNHKKLKHRKWSSHKKPEEQISFTCIILWLIFHVSEHFVWSLPFWCFDEPNARLRNIIRFHNNIIAS